MIGAGGGVDRRRRHDASVVDGGGVLRKAKAAERLDRRRWRDASRVDGDKML